MAEPFKFLSNSMGTDSGPRKTKLQAMQEEARLPLTEKLNAIQTVVKCIVEGELGSAALAVIQLFNQAVAAGVIQEYAIVGGVALVFHAAPLTTQDIDFVVVLPETSGGIVNLGPLYVFFQSRGANAEGEYLSFHGLKFQMIPGNTGLDNEALQKAEPAEEKGVKFRVIAVEYLVAMKLRAGRSKDMAHIGHLLDTGNKRVSRSKLMEILARHDLTALWYRFERLYRLV